MSDAIPYSELPWDEDETWNEETLWDGITEGTLMSNTKKVVTKVFDARAIVKSIDGKKKKTVAYEFSNGRKFMHKDDPYTSQQQGD